MSTTAEEIPFCVPSGWEWSDIIRRPGRELFRLLHYPDNTVRFEHCCDRGERGTIVCAPAIHLGPVDPGWTISRNEVQTHANPKGEPTIRPSVLCPDCGLHGFITDGWWREA